MATKKLQKGKKLGTIKPLTTILKGVSDTSSSLTQNIKIG